MASRNIKTFGTQAEGYAIDAGGWCCRASWEVIVANDGYDETGLLVYRGAVHAI